MGYKTTTDPSKAITGIVFKTGKNPANSISYNGVTYNLLGSSGEPNPGENESVDLNVGASGDYIYTYVTRDKSFNPITDISIKNNSIPEGYTAGVNVSSGSDMNLNSGAGGDNIKLSYKPFSATVTATFCFVNILGNVVKEEWSGTLRDHTQELTASPLTSLTDEFVGWRTDNTAAAPTFSVAKVSYENSGIVYRAVYKRNVELMYNTTDATPVANQIVSRYYLAGTNGIVFQPMTAKITSTIPTHNTKCKFIGWDERVYNYQRVTAGETITLRDGLTFYYVYFTAAWEENHQYTKGVCTACGKHCNHSYDENGACTECGEYEPAVDSNGDGYVEIAKASHLYWFANEVNTGNTNINAILTDDIVVNEGKITTNSTDARAWTPIGNSNYIYKGNFNGNGKTISGLYLNEYKNYIGLFGCVGEKGVVRNLSVENSAFNGSTYCGGITGANYGTIENCCYTGSSSGGMFIAGIAGYNGSTGTIKNCYFAGNVSGANIGYITLKNEGTVTNSYYLYNTENENGAKTAEQFASGEVAYLLQGEQEEIVWGQKIGTEPYPTLGGEKVYRFYTSCGEDSSKYTNDFVDNSEKPDHKYDDKGFCTVCGNAYEEATLNEDGVYEIGNAGQLFWFAEYVNAGNNKANAVLMNDIDLEGRDWVPIGYYSDTVNPGVVYSGTFDGNNHVIKNLSVKVENTYETGLFSRVSEGALKNFGIINAIVENTQGIRAGVVAGEIHKSTVTNVFTAGDITVTTSNTNGQAGGIAGECASTTLTNCYTTYGYLTAVTSATSNNCYYLADTANTESVGTNLTESAFASGELAYQLGKSFGQRISIERYPVLGGLKVFKVMDCSANRAYSNINKMEDHVYINGVCTGCGAKQPIAVFEGNSVSLGGNIALNFYTNLSSEALNDKDTKMIFTVPVNNSSYTVEVPLSNAVINGPYYVFSCEIPVKEMTSLIKAQVVTSNAESEVYEYSVQKYADYVMLQYYRYGYYRDIAPLVKDMLNYGAYAQIYFDYNTDNLAHEVLDVVDKNLITSLDLSDYASSVSGEEDGVSFYGGTLSLKSETAIKLYFEIDSNVDINTLPITVNGKAVSVTKNGKYYELKISDIPAHKLTEMYEIKVGGLTLTYGALSYGNIAMGTDKDELKNVIKAIYAYGQTATEYKNREDILV